VIYFMQPTDGGPLKIGFSDNVDARRKQLESHYGCELAVLATRPGGRAEEREIHERFAAHRLGRTEQFRPVAEIMEFIGRPLLVGPNPAAVEAMPGPAIDTRPVRLDLMPDDHRLLRQLAAKRDMSMAAFARDSLVKVVREEAKKEGIKP
jgi:hypothetical protein